MVDSIFSIQSDTDFEQAALSVFSYQFEHNITYRSYCDLLYKHPSDIKSINDIPFLPIEFFKTREVISKNKIAETIFTSSGTTGSITSKHYVSDLSLYKKSFTNAFEQFYGPVKDMAILALLPSYLERKGSSLVYMVNDLIKNSKNKHSGFCLHNLNELASKLNELNNTQTNVLLIGVSFALLDLIEQTKFNLSDNIVIMETGGMKGKRKEIIRQELHEQLCNGFGVKTIHSEYGMTELLSQAYSKGNGLFETPPWMKILTRDTEDPFHILKDGKSGGINVIDLANINSCSFIATQDLGKTHNTQFEIIGRFDNSDIRGCNLMTL